MDSRVDGTGIRLRRNLLVLIPVGFLGLFFLYPLATILVETVASAEGIDALSRVLTTSQFLDVIWFTLWQASLSTKIARDLLRKDLGYQGLVLTDDLDMKAISLDMETCMYRILKAEVDLALICHQGPAIAQAVDALKMHLESDASLYERASASMGRIRTAKEKFLGSV